MIRKNIKVRTDMFEDTKFKIIDRMEKRDLINYVWFRCMTLAGKVDRDGKLYLSSTKPYTVETLAIEFNREESEVGLAIDVLIELEIMEISGDNVIIVKNFVKHQGIKNNENKDKIVKREESIKSITKEEGRSEKQTSKKKKQQEINKGKGQKKGEQSSKDISLNNEADRDFNNKEILNSGQKEEMYNCSKADNISYEKIQEKLKEKPMLKQDCIYISKQTKRNYNSRIIDPDEIEGIPLLIDVEKEDDDYIEAIGEINEIDEDEEMCGFIDVEEMEGIID